MKKIILALVLIIAAGLGINYILNQKPPVPTVAAAQTPTAKDKITTKSHDITVHEIVSGLEYPWGMAFIDENTILVTEREGALRIIRDGTVSEPISGLPDNVFVRGQGGMLDVALHPDYATNNLIYFSYAGEGEGGANTEVARATLNGNALENVEVIFRADPKTGGANHYGSRLLFLADGTLLITLGERYNYLDEAQSTANHHGTTIRINDDGTIPQDNPFIGQEGAKSEIYTYGHRNAQGVIQHPETGAIWLHEHGPRGGDEVNILKPGANYGWPAITYGIDYSGLKISDKTHMPGMEQPVIHWTPSIAPCGMAYYNGDKFPNWQGNIFVGALAKTHLRRLVIDGDQVVEQEVLLDGFGRVRDVEAGPDGYLYILKDSFDGGLFRIEPAK